MRKFDVWSLAMLLHHIDHAIEVIKPMASDATLRDEKLSQENADMWLTGNITLAENLAQEIHLQSTYDRVWTGVGPFYMASKVGLTWQEAHNELRVLRQAIEADLEKCTFAFIPHRNAELLARMDHDWKSVWTALPDTETDIRDGINCSALEQYTASVFHFMRAVEWGLRAFCYHLGYKNLKSTKKSGQVILIPIEHATWDSILSQLRIRVAERINKIKRGDRRQQFQEFYHKAISEVEGFKDAWRNHVMHSRKNYSSEDAIAVRAHVERFMNLLVSNGVTKV